MPVIRWCIEQEDGSFLVCKEPTSSDLIEYANIKLEDKDEFDCCISDARMAKADNVKRVVSEARYSEVKHECGEGCIHLSDCSLHNAPALPVGECDCGASKLKGD